MTSHFWTRNILFFTSKNCSQNHTYIYMSKRYKLFTFVLKAQERVRNRDRNRQNYYLLIDCPNVHKTRAGPDWSQVLEFNLGLPCGQLGPKNLMNHFCLLESALTRNWSWKQTQDSNSHTPNGGARSIFFKVFFKFYYLFILIQSFGISNFMKK